VSYAENIIYRYDGTFDGFLCCVFESYTKKEMPAAILSENDIQYTIYPEKNIETVLENSQRVFNSFSKKMSKEAEKIIKYAFLTCMENKEITIYKFIRIGYEKGNQVLNMLADDTVSKVLKAVRYLKKEAHLFTGFIRFCELDGFLVSQIEPNNFVLPILAGHFIDRYSQENFVIYDKTYRVALVYKEHKAAIMNIENFNIPKGEEKELLYSQLWKNYYNNIAIKERYNPKCRRNMMPKRYWKNMLEVKEEL